MSGNTGITDKSGKEAKRTLTGIVVLLPRAASRGEAYTARFPFLPSRPPASRRRRAATIGRFSAFALRTQMLTAAGKPHSRRNLHFHASSRLFTPATCLFTRQNAPARRQFARVRLELGRERSSFAYNRWRGQASGALQPDLERAKPRIPRSNGVERRDFAIVGGKQIDSIDRKMTTEQ